MNQDAWQWPHLTCVDKLRSSRSLSHHERHRYEKRMHGVPTIFLRRRVPCNITNPVSPLPRNQPQSAIASPMDHLLEAYASSSSDESGLEEKAAGPSALGDLPPELKSIFKDSGEIRASLLHYTYIWDTPSTQREG